MKSMLVRVLFFILAATAVAQEQTIDLSGRWRLAMDRDNIGEPQKWFGETLPGSDMITLPGSMQAQGFGDAPGMNTSWIGQIKKKEWEKPQYAPYRTAENFKMPFWLQPDKYYKGVVWYQRTVEIPENWDGKFIELELERAHWQTTVWVDSSLVGSNTTLSVPHRYDLSRVLKPGRHLLTIRVDNRMVINIGQNSHSMSDHTQSNWNGLIGELKLIARAATRIEELQIYPDLAGRSIKVITRLAGASGKTDGERLRFDLVFDGKAVAAETVSTRAIPDGGSETIIRINDPLKVWDEFHPNLYTLITRLESAAGVDEERTVFGLREITKAGNRILLNGRPVVMRGTLECCIFPLTGYPPTDVESWKRIIRICKAHGLNHIRFHSWCPPAAAFDAADELGFYYQVECSTWPNQGTSLGDGLPVDQWLYAEADAILRAYGNRPSFLLFAAGNEPGGKKGRDPYLGKWVSHYRSKDSRHLVTSSSGWPELPENDYHDFFRDARIQNWGAGLTSRINSRAPETVTDYSPIAAKYPNQPVITHEIGQWCVYPNFKEMEKYTGVLKPRNFEVFMDFLKQKKMLDQADAFLMASGKLQVLCYKEEIESNLRTRGFGGFQLLDLHDFPGQGTALVGVLDPFWDSKPYVTPAEYHRFCAPIVPLARLPKRVFKSSDTLSAQLELSQFGPADLKNVTIDWSLKDKAGRAVKRGSLHKDLLPAGDLQGLGNVEVNLADLPAPAKYSLEVSVAGTDAVNDWDLWVYPETVPLQSDKVTVVDALDANALGVLAQGGKVLLAVKPAQVKTSVALGFSSIFWNTAWTDNQPPHTLGILCNPQHPALAAFPTEYHSNWQWAVPIHHAATLELDSLPQELKPIIQVVPDWFAPKKLALAFEAKVGGGSLLVCSVDLQTDLASRLEIRQLKSSLLAYMESAAFAPAVELSPEAINSLLK